MAAASASAKLQPWAGWISSGLALVLNHQGLANAIYFDCRLGNPPNAIVLGLASLAIAWAGAIVGWRARRPPLEEPDPPSRSFLPAVGVMLAALYSVTIVFQVLAGLIIPVCAR